ncbi:DUF4156 domain-containing protein [Aliikangiella coralliicola]|uniref:DUF4156 domain-containing protein n=1 Tax=Aliikangiella coralliicola TaxID=2592383 RepID=A0A545UH93_9GAMM|nr:DUF4156 domain-containing protein [Aliikangiella coralliicola]TQV88829.1 DUF4156 domain-containing protein [Aliikangiella coralliicola]
MKKIFIGVIALSLSACQAIKLSPGAEKIRLTHKEPGKECQFLGDITGNQGDFFTGGFTSNEQLETGARNDLKNKAHTMGGNVIYILTQRAGQTSSYDSEHGGGSSQTNVTLTGNVYRCS